jgi:hypothetical protein
MGWPCAARKIKSFSNFIPAKVIDSLEKSEPSACFLTAKTS